MKQWPNALRAAIQIMNMRRFGVLSAEEWDAIQGMPSHLDDQKTQQERSFSGVEYILGTMVQRTRAKIAFTVNDAQEVYARVGAGHPLHRVVSDIDTIIDTLQFADTTATDNRSNRYCPGSTACVCESFMYSQCLCHYGRAKDVFPYTQENP